MDTYYEIWQIENKGDILLSPEDLSEIDTDLLEPNSAYENWIFKQENGEDE
jgi:hypothetical protein